MADTPQSTAPVTPKRRLGWGYLFLTVLILGVAGLFIAAPQLPRQWLHLDPPQPSTLGSEAAQAGAVGGSLSARQVDTELGSLGEVRTWTPKPTAAQPQIDKPVDKPLVAAFKDQARADETLASAEKLYRGMQWSEAASTANRVAGLDAKPITKGRAAEIARSAPKLAKLFKDLGERDELSRDYETHPMLVKLTQGAKDLLAVPVMSTQNPVPLETGDPVAWLKDQGRAGKVAVLMQSARSFIAAEIDLAGYQVERVDVAGVRKTRQTTLERRISDLKVDKAKARDPVAWYEAGKFAFRSRLDEQVVPLLDKALELDPFLNVSIREAKAGIAFGSLVASLKAGNKAQAAGFMARIAKLYPDTLQGKQARAYYDGKFAEMRDLENQRIAAEKQAAEDARKARIEIARAKDDEAKVKEIEAEPIVEEEPVAPPPAGPVNASLDKARSLRDQGQAILNEAMNMPASSARDHKYKDAAKILREAHALFSAYCDKHQDDEAVGTEMIECGKMKFAAIKYASAF